MKKNIAYIFLVIIFAFTIFNYKSIVNYTNTKIGNHFYANGNYEKATTYHEKQKDDLKFYNLGNDFYKLGNYGKSLENYSNEGLDETPELFHNLGNVFFRMREEIYTPDSLNGQNENDFSVLVYEELLFSSIENYEKSLKLKERKKTRENYEFVKSKLEELKKNQEEEKKEEEKQRQNQNSNNDDSQGKEKKQDNKDGEKSGSEEASSGLEDGEEQNGEQDNPQAGGGRDEQYKLSEGQKADEINKYEEDAIKKYTNKLKAEQKNNQQFFNKKSTENKNSDIIDSLINDSLNFDSNFYRGGEKDW